MSRDLELALHLADLADGQTLPRWRPTGVTSTAKADGTPVAAEEAVLAAMRGAGDGFLGEEAGASTPAPPVSSNGSRHDEVLVALARGW